MLISLANMGTWPKLVESAHPASVRAAAALIVELIRFACAQVVAEKLREHRPTIRHVESASDGEDTVSHGADLVIDRSASICSCCAR